MFKLVIPMVQILLCSPEENPRAACGAGIRGQPLPFVQAISCGSIPKGETLPFSVIFDPTLI